ncbi:MAG TPA: RNA polymerase sigma factor [Longimicrobiales bacterium]|nr:RNA polymerase sigma factor [Longimicrobiales bacterium]
MHVRPDGPPAIEEAALLERARAGEPEARELLVRRYVDDVYRLTVRILGDRDLAQDATQDAFVNALGALHRFRGDASFRTWLLRIAVNAARSIGRRQVRRREVNLVLADHEPSRGQDPATRAENATEVERVERVLATLPRKQRMAVALRVQQGLSYAEIAAALDCSEGAARVNYHLGVKRLRELLK